MRMTISAAFLPLWTSSGPAQTTDIVVVSDHGFSTISKQSLTSPSAKLSYAGVPAGSLPPGFLAIDLAKELNLSLFDPGTSILGTGQTVWPRAWRSDARRHDARRGEHGPRLRSGLQRPANRGEPAESW
jgi:hypothetical protein